MIDAAATVSRPFTELFLVRGEIVAQQQSYRFTFVRENHHEIRHFYCPKCGQVWGLRIEYDTDAPAWHSYCKSTCKSCGGHEDMLTDFEWQNLQVLSESVMAHTLLQWEKKDEEV